MAKVIITVKIMPEDPSVNLKLIEEKCVEKVKSLGLEFGKKEVEPIAFGLNALKLYLIQDEKQGGTAKLESELSKIQGVNSVEVIDVRRAIG